MQDHANYLPQLFESPDLNIWEKMEKEISKKDKIISKVPIIY